MKIFIILILSIFIVGCSRTTVMKSEKNSTAQKLGMFTTEANTRVIIANINEGRFCAEPPPETQLTESKSFSLMLDAALKSDDTKVQIQAFKTFSQGLRQLYKRSHSNQMYRDASYYLCQGYLNGALSEKSTKVLFKTMLSDINGKGKQEVNSEINTLIEKLDDDAISINSSYLIAQLVLSKWAFESLENENDKFYLADQKENEIKAQAYDNVIQKLGSNVDLIKSKTEEINTTSNSILSKTNSNSEKLDTLSTELEKVPKK